MAKIVLCEDTPTQQKTIYRLLSSLGHQVIVCRTGVIGLPVLEDNPDVDVLITDMVMPNMDGPTLINILRDHPKLSNLPIIAITSMDSDTVPTAIKDLGIRYFVPKPLKRPELALVLDEVFAEINAKV